jgi:hypothetical protein
MGIERIAHVTVSAFISPKNLDYTNTHTDILSFWSTDNGHEYAKKQNVGDEEAM